MNEPTHAHDKCGNCRFLGGVRAMDGRIADGWRCQNGDRGRVTFMLRFSSEPSDYWSMSHYPHLVEDDDPDEPNALVYYWNEIGNFITRGTLDQRGDLIETKTKG